MKRTELPYSKYPPSSPPVQLLSVPLPLLHVLRAAASGVMRSAIFGDLNIHSHLLII